MQKNILQAILFLLLTNQVIGQVELQKIMPVSPNAAAIAKYGEIPVGYFTGVPSINVPLYEIKSRELQLPLSLSYHAGGNKVEDIASWVGLGWSVGSIPCISRTVRGIEDDGGAGYFSLYSGKTVKQVYDERFSGGGVSTYANFLSDIRGGTADSEPDIFSYSLANKSGKFYYNQQKQRFYTIPYDNLIIQKITNGFRIISDDGTRYDFNVVESSIYGLSTATNSWWVSKIVNANHTDSILFDYVTQTETFSTIASVTKNIYTGGDADCSFPHYESNSVTTITTSAKPDKISFSTGYINFIPQSTNRSDLNGGKALDRVEIYNNDDQLIKEYKFKYSYLQGYGCGNAEDCYRLVLDSVWEESSSAIAEKPFVFTYNTGISIPGRLSPAQDFWGYYNGATDNSDLVPPLIYDFPSDPYPRKLAGGDRNVNTSYTQFGILTKIAYPTGGTSEFEYENNWVNDLLLPIKQKDTSVILSGNGVSQGMYGVYEKNFTIDVPADADLNNNEGGTFVKVTITNLGCDISGGADICANLTITGVGNSYNSGSIISNLDALYLPNGNFKMTAEFYQDPDEYENFIFALEWRKADSAYVANRLAGGLRVKKITGYDGIDHQRDLIRTFSYGSDSSENISSGKVFGVPFFNFKDFYTYEKYSSNLSGGCDYCYAELLRWSSTSNITAVSHSGSFVGYNKIVVDYGSSAENGRSVYWYQNTPDQVSTFFPFPPSLSLEQRRGLLLEGVDYRKSASDFRPVRRIRNSYQPYTYYADTTFNDINAYALKIATKNIVIDPCNTFPNLAAQTVYPYSLQTDWMQISGSEDKLYSADDTTSCVVTTTGYNYNAGKLQLKSVETLSSAGDAILNVSNYPHELSLAGTAETARLGLISQNRVSTVLQKVKKVNDVPKELVQTDYKEFSSGKIYAENLQVQIAAAAREIRVWFNAYDSNGNLTDQQKENDIIQSYLWDYNSNYPIAEVINASSTNIAHTSFESDGKGNWSFSGSTTIHPSAPTGKKGYSLAGGNITKSGLSSGTTYIVTYWKRDSSSTVTVNSGSGTDVMTKNGWKLIRHEITGTTSMTVAGTAYIDELRLHPREAMMSTYTYEPLIGMTSQSDPNNRIAYYEYDAFSRLRLIRDHDKNVVKKFCYNYAGQPESCITYYSVQKSGNFTRNNCGSGYAGTPVTYTVPAGIYQASSQGAADTLAQNEVDANGQAYANANGSCLLIYYNVVKSGNYTRNNCGAGYTGNSVTYTVPASTYSSTVSQNYVDSVAQADVNFNGQAYANSNGTCSQILLTVTYNNSSSESFTASFTNVSTSQVYNLNVNASTSGGTAGQIPPGTYNVSIIPYNQGFALFNINVCTHYEYGVNSANAYNLSITGSGCAVINISDY